MSHVFDVFCMAYDRVMLRSVVVLYNCAPLPGFIYMQLQPWKCCQKVGSEVPQFSAITYFVFVMHSWWHRRNCERDFISPIVKPVSPRMHNKDEEPNWNICDCDSTHHQLLLICRFRGGINKIKMIICCCSNTGFDDLSVFAISSQLSAKISVHSVRIFRWGQQLRRLNTIHERIKAMPKI